MGTAMPEPAPSTCLLSTSAAKVGAEMHTQLLDSVAGVGADGEVGSSGPTSEQANIHPGRQRAAKQTARITHSPRITHPLTQEGWPDPCVGHVGEKVVSAKTGTDAHRAGKATRSLELTTSLPKYLSYRKAC